MNDLLELAAKAQGGLDRWQQLTEITAHVSISAGRTSATPWDRGDGGRGWATEPLSEGQPRWPLQHDGDLHGPAPVPGRSSPSRSTPPWIAFERLR
ncbi:hypothetical protein ACTXG6_07910 [Pseudonocardia sp. Cha107L01]|jgi:hypothetical protein|uniref:hypothetical protein n=1 Tax=Pseudonocardia sp. Cha107L01 TaxID=3457576 RepID=UPI00403EEA23